MSSPYNRRDIMQYDSPTEKRAQQEQPYPEHLLAAIDLGSNSFHMVIARQDHNEIRTLERFGEKVQLTAGLDAENQLSEAAMQRGWHCLRRFAQYIEHMPPGSVRVVGTSVLRQARNNLVFTQQASKILGHPVEVIAGREEARLIYLGVAQTQSDDAGKRLVLDIGGGSTECIIGEHFEASLLESLPLGCINYSQTFFPDGFMNAQRLDALFYAARLEFLQIQQAFRKTGWSNAVGASGTIKSVQTILDAMGLGDDGITQEGLALIHQSLLQFDHLDHVVLPGLNTERAAILPAGITILRAAFKAFKITQMQYSSGALREGVLYDMVGRLQHEDVRERSVTAMAQRYHTDQRHAQRIQHTLNWLFQKTAPQWHLNQHDYALLQWATALHEMGLDISHNNFHKHSAYLVEHADMMGFTRKEQRDLAFLIRSQRRALPKKYFARTPLPEVRLLRLCLLFRLAIAFNHSRKDQGDPLCRVHITGAHHIQLCWPEGWLDQHPLILASLEKEADYLSAAGYRLTFC